MYNYFVWDALKCTAKTWTVEKENTRRNASLVHFTASAGWLNANKQKQLTDPVKYRVLVNTNTYPCIFQFYGAWADSWNNIRLSQTAEPEIVEHGKLAKKSNREIVHHFSLRKRSDGQGRT